MIRYAIWSLLLTTPALAADMGSPIPLEQRLTAAEAEIGALKARLADVETQLRGAPKVMPATAAKPIVSPFGTAPAAGFVWKELPGVGPGWVHESVDVKTFTSPPVATRTAAPFQPIRYTLGAVGNCVNGQCFR